MAITLPGSQSESSQNYVKAIKVEFKANKGEFHYYDGENIIEKSLVGIIVGEGFQFKGIKGRPTSKKSHNYESQVFGYDSFKNGTIKIHQFIREGENKSNSSMGAKTYTEWKEEKLTLNKVLYMLCGEQLFQINFTPIAIKPVNDFIRQNKDIPNYISELTISVNDKGEPNFFENDMGEFYVPAIKKLEKIKPEDENKVVENITMIDKIVNNKEDITLPSNDIPQPNAHKATANNSIDLDDLPF